MDRTVINTTAAILHLSLLGKFAIPGSFVCWQAWQEDTQSPSPTAENLLDTRKKLLRRLQRDVQQRLGSSLHQLTKLDLQMEDQQQQVGQSRLPLVAEDPLEQGSASSLNRVLQVFQTDTPEAQMPPTQKMVKVFDRSDIQGKLLILGEPGAGKTTELLTLAQDLLQQTTDDEMQAIPVIFELSAWKQDKPIAGWLVERLTVVYNVAPAIAQQWLEEQSLLPLLDGLDELGLERQRKCIEFINQFLSDQAQPHCVVCCRREEYEQGQLKLDQMKGAVYLRSLTHEQIQGYFQQLNRSHVWQSVQQNPELLELARSPLFLAMLVYSNPN